jgi:16S rRNA G966 N2-methylase RsmD
MTTKPHRARPQRSKVVPIHAPPAVPVHPFDRLHGTDTGGLIPGAALASGSISDTHITAYYAIAPSILNGLIDLWLASDPPHPIDEYTLIDVGAGKGRAILTAAQHPFRLVVGIEINAGLVSIARENIQRFTKSGAADLLAPVQILHVDALEMTLPTTPTVITMFHPFEAPILWKFLAKLEKHQAERPGALDILYTNAEHATLLDRNPHFTRLFNGMLPMSAEDHLADLAEIAGQREYGSTGDEFCTIHRFMNRF